MKQIFEKARQSDLPIIWQIIKDAIARRKKDGSQQWQNGYPNEVVIQHDIENGYAFVLKRNGEIMAYSALIINKEPSYEKIEGAWLSDGDFLVFHRLALAEKYLRKGMAKELIAHIVAYAKAKKIPSIKVDTNFDNIAMLKTLKYLNFTYCGEIKVRGESRQAFEKIICV